MDQLDANRQDFFSGDFEGLLVSSEYDPWSILEMTYAHLSGSAPIVFHSPHLQIFVDLQAKMKSAGGYLGANITEAWKRKYQVLPGRTHPMMNMSGTGGYVLHAFKIFDDPDAQAILVHRQKKRKVEKPAEAQGTTESPGEDVVMSELTEDKQAAS